MLEQLDCAFEVKAVAEDGQFEGLASTFGNRDLLGDVIAPGAFKDSIANPGAIRMLWQHDHRDVIGRWSDLRETKEGLYAKGQLILDVQRAREARALLKAKAVDALSIGFRIPDGGVEIDRDSDTRILKKIELHEISIVTFPANPKARVSTAKALLADGQIPTRTDMERLLHEVGLSRRQARGLLAKGYAGLVPEAADAELAEAVERAIAVLRG